MYNRLGMILTWDAHPQVQGKWDQAGRMAIRVSASSSVEHDDLVEYSWPHMGQGITVTAGRNALELAIDLESAEKNPELARFGKSTIDRVRGLLENTVRMQGETLSLEREPFELHVPWPDVLADGARFSTAPDRPINRMDSVHWYERVDFSVRGRQLAVMFYFKPGQLMQPQDGSRWFDDAFRAKVLAREGATDEADAGESQVEESP